MVEISRALFQWQNLLRKNLTDTHMFMFLKGSPMQHSDLMFEYANAFKENKSFENYDIPKLIGEIGKLRKLIKNGLIENTKFFLHPKYVDLYSDKSLSIIEDLLDKPSHNPKNIILSFTTGNQFILIMMGMYFHVYLFL